MSLAVLRVLPVDACRANIYKTGPEAGSFTNTGQLVEGGRCKINEEFVKPGMYHLKAEASAAGTDYFFPWLRTAVGYVKVPLATPDGTVVLTGGVNGCSIVVSKHQNDYYFYHDGDSKFLRPEMVQGNEVARVGPNDYDPMNQGMNQFSAALGAASRAGVKPVGDVSYGHFVFAVKASGQFGLYSTGVMSLNGFTKLAQAALPLCPLF